MTIGKLFVVGLILGSSMARAEIAPVANEKWFQLQTPNFTVFSAGRLDETRYALGRLEQFREAYASLAGAKAVASLPILVFAFPNNEAFKPFQPVYQGKPMRVGGFFQRDYDENVIAINLDEIRSGSMETIFHEYTHLLMRRNDRVWPLWLKEGMAEVYSTFLIENSRVCLGVAKTRHLDLLQRHPLLPLVDLFKAKTDSPEYNERDLRGIFYAESWALTHYLVLGDSPVRKAQFATFARRLREGAPVETAFTESFQTTLAAMEEELKRYLARRRFEPICYKTAGSVATLQPRAERVLPQLEVLYQLGNLLLHCHRAEEADEYFRQARHIAPDSPRSYEGLGLAAARRKNHSEAIRFFEEALARQSMNYRAHYGYAREIFSGESSGALKKAEPSDRLKKAREALRRSVELMPAFAPAHYLLGQIEQQTLANAAVSGQHLRTAVELEPENLTYVLALGELQINRREFAAARQTLTPLLNAEADPELRRIAERLLKALDDPRRKRTG